MNEPDGTSTWLPVNDHPTDKATWRFEITVPEGSTAIANGDARGHGPTTPTGTSTWTWDQREPMASYLVLLLIGDYELRRRRDVVDRRRPRPCRAAPATRADLDQYPTSSTAS